MIDLKSNRRALVNTVAVELMVILILVGALLSFVFPLQSRAGFRRDSGSSNLCVDYDTTRNGLPIIEETKSFHILAWQADDYTAAVRQLDPFDQSGCGSGPTAQYRLFL